MNSRKDPGVSTLFDQSVGEYCHKLAQELFPICRSLTGPGVRETLEILKRELPDLKIQSVPSQTQAFDWVVPDEWTIRDAYITDESGKKIVDFKKHNLHVVGYSIAVDQWLEKEELDKYLYSNPEVPNAIPYVTSYYSRRWGFCLSHDQRQALKPGKYRAVIDADLKPGVLNYGEILIPGKSTKEIFLSTDICHPSLANNELSGPVVATGLAKWISSLENRNYSYRIVYIPETIGSIVYLSKNLKQLKENVIAGYVLTCIGDERCYSYLPSRNGQTLSDQAAKHVLKHIDPNHKSYTWLKRGSDERQYCAPGVDLPMATIMRSKYVDFPEYHSSLDDLNFITPKGLEGGFQAVKQAIEVIENNYHLNVTVLGEPQLGKRGLYPTFSTKESGLQVRMMMNLISYCDGRTLLEIAEILDQPVSKLLVLLKPLIENGLIEARMTK